MLAPLRQTLWWCRKWTNWALKIIQSGDLFYIKGQSGELYPDSLKTAVILLILILFSDRQQNNRPVHIFIAGLTKYICVNFKFMKIVFMLGE